MATTIWTIVPMRGIEAGKSRLAAVLDAASRARLNRWLLSHTLAVIERWHGDLKRCVVVSPCDQALELARRARTAGGEEIEGVQADDLNGALPPLSLRGARRRQGLLVLPCDLPEDRRGIAGPVRRRGAACATYDARARRGGNRNQCAAGGRRLGWRVLFRRAQLFSSSGVGRRARLDDIDIQTPGVRF